MKIAIVGCGGRMGRLLVKQVYQSHECTLIGGTEHKESTLINHDIGDMTGIGPLGVFITANTQRLFEHAECVIDFTAPEATAFHICLARDMGCSLVVGTTGLDQSQISLLQEASSHIPIVWSANMSLGVHILLSIIEKTSQILSEEEFDIEILEMHHHHKSDIPSGTALALAQAAAKGRQCPSNMILPHGHPGLRKKRYDRCICFTWRKYSRRALCDVFRSKRTSQLHS